MDSAAMAPESGMLLVNGERLLDDLQRLGQIGRTAGEGVSRLAMSPADAEGRQWCRSRIEASGLQFREDGISALMDSHVMEAIERATATLGLSHMRLMSMAGHDAQIMASVAPCGMIFVPPVGGASHNATELTNPSDVVRGANALLHTLLELVPNTG